MRITDIQNRQIDWNDVPFADEDLEKARPYEITIGDILFARTGATVGKSHLIKTVFEPSVFASYLIRVRSHTEILFPEFAAWYFQSPGYWEQITQGAEGTGQPNFNGSKLAALSLPIPPPAEQRRIVEKLDALTNGLAVARSEIDRAAILTRILRRNIFNAAVSGQLSQIYQEAEWNDAERASLNLRRIQYLKARRGSRLHSSLEPKISYMGDSRSGWLNCRLADVVSLRVGHAFKSSDFSDDGIPLLRGANIAPGRVDWTDSVRLPVAKAGSYSEYLVSEGDILLAMDRPIISSGLKIAQANEVDAGSLLVQRVANPRPSKFILIDYLMIVLNSSIFLDQISDHATGSDLPHISGNDILTTPCPLPPLETQKKIVLSVNAALARTDRLEAETARAKTLLNRLELAILAKAFRGELVAQDPTDEPASILLERLRAQSSSVPPKRRQSVRDSTSF